MDRLVDTTGYPCPYSGSDLVNDLLCPVIHLLPESKAPQDAHPGWKEIYVNYATKVYKLHASWEILLSFRRQFGSATYNETNELEMEELYDNSAELFWERSTLIGNVQHLYKTLQLNNPMTNRPFRRCTPAEFIDPQISFSHFMQWWLAN